MKRLGIVGAMLALLMLLALPVRAQTPLALVNATVAQAASADPVTHWTTKNHANVTCTAVKTGVLTLVRLLYSDTSGMTFSGASARTNISITPLVPGSPVPGEIKFSMTALVKAYTDQVTFDLKYAGNDAQGNPAYTLTFEAWDSAHTTEYVKADGAVDSALSTALVGPPVQMTTNAIGTATVATQPTVTFYFDAQAADGTVFVVKEYSYQMGSTLLHSTFAEVANFSAGKVPVWADSNAVIVLHNPDGSVSVKGAQDQGGLFDIEIAPDQGSGSYQVGGGAFVKEAFPVGAIAQ